MGDAGEGCPHVEEKGLSAMPARLFGQTQIFGERTTLVECTMPCLMREAFRRDRGETPAAGPISHYFFRYILLSG